MNILELKVGGIKTNRFLFIFKSLEKQMKGSSSCKNGSMYVMKKIMKKELVYTFMVYIVEYLLNYKMMN